MSHDTADIIVGRIVGVHGIRGQVKVYSDCRPRESLFQYRRFIAPGTVLMPFGGKYQKTPIGAMVNKISVEKSDTSTCSVMSYAYNPFISEKDQYKGAYLAVSKLIEEGHSRIAIIEGNPAIRPVYERSNGYRS